MQVGDHFGKYRLVGLLGEGGMGEVWDAHDQLLDCRVALKVLPRRRSRDACFSVGQQREGRVLARMAHPNIVRLHDLGLAEGHLYVAMELVPGITLKEFLVRAGPLRPVDGLYIGVQIAEAIRVSHEAGVIHRDLKPENVMVKQEGAITVLDFGIAKVEDSASTDVFKGVGTAQYMSPEQALGQEAGKASDVYSLGLIVHEMVTGGYAFLGEDGRRPTRDAALMKQIHEAAPRIEEVVPGLCLPVLSDLLERMLAKDPEARPGAEEVRKVLHAEYKQMFEALPPEQRRFRYGEPKAVPVEKPMAGPRPLPPDGAGRRNGAAARNGAGSREETAPLAGSFVAPALVLPFVTAAAAPAARRAAGAATEPFGIEAAVAAANGPVTESAVEAVAVSEAVPEAVSEAMSAPVSAPAAVPRFGPAPPLPPAVDARAPSARDAGAPRRIQRGTWLLCMVLGAGIVELGRMSWTALATRDDPIEETSSVAPAGSAAASATPPASESAAASGPAPASASASAPVPSPATATSSPKRPSTGATPPRPAPQATPTAAPKASASAPASATVEPPPPPPSAAAPPRPF